MANPLLEEIERWQSIYDWFTTQGSTQPDSRIRKFEAEAVKVEGFLRHMIASTNISTPPSTTPDQTKGLDS
jgi:hypothetical protein